LNRPRAEAGPAPGTVLCRLDEIADGDARAVGFRMFVVRLGGAVRAYVNNCPHTDTPLDWRPGEFLDPGGTMLRCASHGALFRPDDGVCTEGPCRGKRLEAVPVVVEDGVIRVAAAAQSPVTKAR